MSDKIICYCATCRAEAGLSPLPHIGLEVEELNRVVFALLEWERHGTDLIERFGAAIAAHDLEDPNHPLVVATALLAQRVFATRQLRTDIEQVTGAVAFEFDRPAEERSEAFDLIGSATITRETPACPLCEHAPHPNDCSVAQCPFRA